eukprot:EG_transcript_49576
MLNIWCLTVNASASTFAEGACCMDRGNVQDLSVRKVSVAAQDQKKWGKWSTNYNGLPLVEHRSWARRRRRGNRVIRVDEHLAIRPGGHQSQEASWVGPNSAREKARHIGAGSIGPPPKHVRRISGIGP